MTRSQTFFAKSSLLIPTCVLLTSACGPIEPGGTPGAQNHGGFLYCEKTSDSCAGGTVPDAIAVGSTFGLGFDGPTVTLSSPTPQNLEALGTSGSGVTTFRALAAGPARVEARAMDTNQLIDFLVLTLSPVRTLPLQVCSRDWNAIPAPGAPFDRSSCQEGDAGASGTVTISRGADLAPTVCVFPTDAAGDALGGRLSFDWTPSAATGAGLEFNIAEDGRCATIGGLTTGAATVTVSTGQVSGSLQVTVIP